jgi:hypothetical protein
VGGLAIAHGFFLSYRQVAEWTYALFFSLRCCLSGLMLMLQCIPGGRVRLTTAFWPRRMETRSVHTRRSRMVSVIVRTTNWCPALVAVSPPSSPGFDSMSSRSVSMADNLCLSMLSPQSTKQYKLIRKKGGRGVICLKYKQK